MTVFQISKNSHYVTFKNFIKNTTRCSDVLDNFGQNKFMKSSFFLEIKVDIFWTFFCKGLSSQIAIKTEISYFAKVARLYQAP